MAVQDALLENTLFVSKCVQLRFVSATVLLPVRGVIQFDRFIDVGNNKWNQRPCDISAFVVAA